MDWSEIEEELKHVEKKLKQGVDVVPDLKQLGESIAHAVRDDAILREMPNNMDILALAEEARVARQLLQVGTLELPSAADKRLLALAKRISHDLICVRTESDIQSTFAMYREEAQAVTKLVETLREEIEQLESQAIMFDQYHSLLTLLESSGKR